MQCSRPPEPIVLLSIGPGAPGQPSKIIYLDKRGRGRRELEIVALAPPSWVPTPETTAPTTDEFGSSDLPLHRLDLTDGEGFAAGAGADEAARGRSGEGDRPMNRSILRAPSSGHFAFPLDRVWRYWAQRLIA